MAKRQYRSTAYFLLVGSTLILLVTGLVMVLNASSVQAYSAYGDSYFYIKRQIFWMIPGLAGLVFFARTDYHKVVKFSSAILVFVVFALALSHLPGIGQSAKGASRAIGFGSYTFQPSELAKLAVILYLAGVLAAKRRQLHELKALASPGLIILVVMGLVLLQPDLGTTVVIALTALTMLFLGGLRVQHVLGLTFAFGTGGFAFAMAAPYRRNRILAFLNPSANPQGIGYQIRQSLIGIGSGGLTGVGLGMSRQKFFFLPESHTDFIFAIIGEELGILGCLMVVGAFCALVGSGLNIAFNTKDYLGKVLGAGITASIAGQALINFGAVTDILPVTGVPLPLVSYGGSSLIVTLSLLGILINIALASRGRRVSGSKADENNTKWRRNSRTRLPRARTTESAGVR